MGVGAGLYMYVVVVQKFTFAISSPDEFLFKSLKVQHNTNIITKDEIFQADKETERQTDRTDRQTTVR